MGCGNVESLERVQQATGVDRFHYLWAGLMKREQGTKRFRTIFVFLREDFDFCEPRIFHPFFYCGAEVQHIITPAEVLSPGYFLLLVRLLW